MEQPGWSLVVAALEDPGDGKVLLTLLKHLKDRGHRLALLLTLPSSETSLSLNTAPSTICEQAFSWVDRLFLLNPLVSSVDGDLCQVEVPKKAIQQGLIVDFSCRAPTSRECPGKKRSNHLDDVSFQRHPRLRVHDLGSGLPSSMPASQLS